MEAPEQGAAAEGEPASSLWAYSAAGEGQISVGEGEALSVLSRDHGEWWYVRLADGQCGYLPGSYVRLASAAAGGSGGDAPSSEASSRASPASSHGSMSRFVSRAADKKKQQQQQQQQRPPPTLEEPEPEREVEAPKPGWAPQGEVEELQAELSKAKQKMKIYHDENKKLFAQKKELEQQGAAAAGLRRELEALQTEHAKAERKLKVFHEENTKLFQQKKEWEQGKQQSADAAETAQSAAAVAAELEALKVEHAKAEAQLATAQAENAALFKEKEVLAQERREAVEQQDLGTTESKALEAALSATEQRATATETRNELLQAAAAEHAQTEQNLRSEIDSLRKALEAAAAEHVGMSPRKEVERLRQQLEESREENARLEEEVEIANESAEAARAAASAAAKRAAKGGKQRPQSAPMETVAEQLEAKRRSRAEGQPRFCALGPTQEDDGRPPRPSSSASQRSTASRRRKSRGWAGHGATNTRPRSAPALHIPSDPSLAQVHGKRRYKRPTSASLGGGGMSRQAGRPASAPRALLSAAEEMSTVMGEHSHSHLQTTAAFSHRRRDVLQGCGRRRPRRRLSRGLAPPRPAGASPTRPRRRACRRRRSALWPPRPGRRRRAGRARRRRSSSSRRRWRGCSRRRGRASSWARRRSRARSGRGCRTPTSSAWASNEPDASVHRPTYTSMSRMLSSEML